MTDDEIEDEIADLTAKMNAASGRTAGLRRQISRLKAIKADRGNAVRRVNDHALLRYMERHKGIDINAMRNEVRRLAANALPLADGEHHRHPSGVVMIMDEEGTVVTVLSDDQSEKFAERRFKETVDRLLATPPKPR